jgi:hypothetical protein
MNDATQLVVAANGHVSVAPATDAVLPDDVSTALDSAFVDLGFCDESGVKFIDTNTFSPVAVWQSLYPARQLLTSKETTAAFVLKQWNTDSIELAFGGGAVTVVSGLSTYTPPLPSDAIDYRAAVIEWEDGTLVQRIVIPRCMVTGSVETDLTRTATTDLPLTLSAMPIGAPDIADLSTFAWFLLSNDPALTA